MQPFSLSAITRFAALCLSAALLSACGGGSSPSPAGGGTAPSTTVGGTAATGNPIVGGTVSLRCQNSTSASATTNATGVWSTSVTTANLPCVIEISGGTVGGSANTQTFFAVTVGSGGSITVNISPLTSLVLADITGSPVDHADFTGLSGADIQTLTSGLAAAITSLQTALGNAGFTLPAGTFNPFITAFSAVAGDDYDDLLEQLQASFTVAVPDLATLIANYGSGGTLPTAVVDEAATSASGTVTLGNDSSFSPQATGFTVTVSGNDLSTEYRFHHQTSPSSIETLTVTQPAAGPTRVTHYNPTTRTISSCTSNCGVVISSGESTHPVTLTFSSSVLGALTLNGSLTGDTSGALWSPSELPRTSTGSVNFGSGSVSVIGVTDNSSGGTTNITATLSDRSTLNISATSIIRSFSVSISPAQALTHLCSSSCGFSVLTNEGGGKTVSFENSALPVLANSTSLPSTALTLNGSFTTSARTGTLTNNGELTAFTPTNDNVEAENNGRTYVFDNYSASGNMLLSVSTTNGALVSVTLTANFGGTQYSCFTGSAAAVLNKPVCTGMTVAADGRTLTFVSTVLRGGAGNADITFNGTLVGRGL